MQIKFLYPSGPRSASTAIILGDDSVKEFITDYRPGLTCEVQVSAPPRAQWKQAFARGLGEAPVSWQVERSLGDYAKSIAFMHDHMLVLQANPSGILNISQDGTTGASVTYKKARLQALQVTDHRGAFFVMQYRFWCAELSTSQT